MPKRKNSTDNSDLLGVDDNPLMQLPKYLGDPNADDNNLDLLGEEDDDEDLSKLQDQFESLQGRFDQNQELTQQLLMQLATSNNGPRQTANAPEEIKFDDLPDPVEDRAGFNTELGARIGKLLDQTRTQTMQASQNDAGYANLEATFRSNYEDLAQKPALFQSVVTQRVRQLRARGLDPTAFVFAQPEKFIKEVADQMYDELGIDPEAEEDDDGEGAERRGGKRKVLVKRNAANRTKGLGKPSGDLNARNRSGNDKDKAKGFVDQLKKTQLENGLI